MYMEEIHLEEKKVQEVVIKYHFVTHFLYLSLSASTLLLLLLLLFAG